MLKKLLANATMKKSLLFVVAFAITSVSMGGALVGISDSDAMHMGTLYLTQDDVEMDNVWMPQSGTYSEFVALVQSANTSSQKKRAWLEDEETVPASLEYYSGGESEEVPDFEEELNVIENSFTYVSAIPLSEELQQYTYERCQELDIEYELVLAVMWRESRFNVNAVGYNSNGTRDNGIMQINDINREWLRQKYGIDNLMDPYQNIAAGTAMLADYVHNYGDEKSALMAYHLGEAGMRRKLAQGVTTNNQVTAALVMRDSYRDLIAEEERNRILALKEQEDEAAAQEEAEASQEDDYAERSIFDIFEVGTI